MGVTPDSSLEAAISRSTVILTPRMSIVSEGKLATDGDVICCYLKIMKVAAIDVHLDNLHLT